MSNIILCLHEDLVNASLSALAFSVCFNVAILAGVVASKSSTDNYIFNIAILGLEIKEILAYIQLHVENLLVTLVDHCQVVSGC